jgi:hypothetical protein
MLPAHPYTNNFEYAMFNLRLVDIMEETARPETELITAFSRFTSVCFGKYHQGVEAFVEPTSRTFKKFQNKTLKVFSECPPNADRPGHRLTFSQPLPHEH